MTARARVHRPTFVMHAEDDHGTTHKVPLAARDLAHAFTLAADWLDGWDGMTAAAIVPTVPSADAGRPVPGWTANGGRFHVLVVADGTPDDARPNVAVCGTYATPLDLPNGWRQTADMVCGSCLHQYVGALDADLAGFVR